MRAYQQKLWLVSCATDLRSPAALLMPEGETVLVPARPGEALKKA